MSALLDVKLDTSKLEAWASELSARGFRNAIRRAVDQSATAARRVALDTIARDIGVPKARIKDAVGKVRRTTQATLSASFTTSKAAINILSTSGASVSRAGGLSASSFRISGGGSVNLNAPHAFIMNVNGARFVVQRKGKARSPTRGIFAESPSTAMAKTALRRRQLGAKPPRPNSRRGCRARYRSSSTKRLCQPPRHLTLATKSRSKNTVDTLLDGSARQRR